MKAKMNDTCMPRPKNSPLLPKSPRIVLCSRGAEDMKIEGTRGVSRDQDQARTPPSATLPR